MNKITLKTLENYTDLKKIFNALGINNARLVGGCVRDIIVERNVLDYDFATIHSPEDTIKCLKEHNIKAIPTGIKYGTITAVINNKNYEITSLRKDVKTFGRDATVEFTDIWEEDAKRRDFTINALYLDFEGTVYDYFDGRIDLQKYFVKFIGNPETRIKEDYLRILRYFRFIAYFGKKNIDTNSLHACGKYKERLNDLSEERIHNELHKMFHVEHLLDAIELMDNFSILETLGFQRISLIPERILEHKEFYIRFAVFLICYSSKENRQELLKKYRFSNLEIKQILLLSNWNYVDNFIPSLNHAKYYHGIDTTKDLISMHYILTGKIVENIDKYLKPIPNIPIKSDYLIKLGYNGERLGKELKKLEAIWINSNFTLSKDELLNEIEK